jgi:hypothetical protein
MSADGASEEARRTDEDLAHVCVISVYGRGEQMKMSLPKSTSIEEMRRLIREKAGDDAEFRLIHGGRCLLDGETLGDAVRLGQVRRAVIDSQKYHTRRTYPHLSLMF